MNTHLHLMEALSVLYRLDRSPRVAVRLAELVGIQSNAVVRKTAGACTDRYRRDWTPILDDADSARASYGHDLENIWLIVDALGALGQPTAPYHDLFRQLFAYSMRHGYDQQQGGFYDSGPLGEAADRRAKVWWVQAEALVSALTMYSLTREPEYARVFQGRKGKVLHRKATGNHMLTKKTGSRRRRVEGMSEVTATSEKKTI